MKHSQYYPKAFKSNTFKQIISKILNCKVSDITSIYNAETVMSCMCIRVYLKMKHKDIPHYQGHEVSIIKLIEEYNKQY